MNKKILLALLPILIGVIGLISYFIIGSRVTLDGTLEEPFFLIPLSYLFVFSGIALLLFMAIISVIKKNKHNNQ